MRHLVSENEVKRSCNDTSLTRQCDPSLEGNGCDETAECYQDVCSFVSEATEENLCFNVKQALSGDVICLEMACTGTKTVETVIFEALLKPVLLTVCCVV